MPMDAGWGDHELDDRWESLATAYREACPDPDASPDFMPKLWGKIDARRNTSIRIWALTKGFVTAAGCLCLLFTALLALPASSYSNSDDTYVEALDEHATADLAALEPVRSDFEAPNQ